MNILDLKESGDVSYDRMMKFQEAATTGEFPNLLRADYKDILLSAYGKVDQPLFGLADVVPSANETETYRGLTALQDVTTEVPQGAPYGEILLSEKDTVTITNKKYGGLIAVTDEMIRFNKLSEMNRLGSMLGESLARNVEIKLAAAIENTSNTTAATGAALTLNRANLEVVLAQFKSQTATAADGSTVKLGLIPDTLLVPPDLEFTAKRLMLSTLIPGAVDNDPNVIKGMLNIVVSHDLSSTSAWYVLKSKWANGLKFQKVIGPPPELSVQDMNATQSDGVFKYDKISYKARMLFGVGVIDPVWCISSAG